MMIKDNHQIGAKLDTILSITAPEEGKLRARRVVSRSRARSTGKYPSWKMDRMIQWESIHERNAFLLLDADPTVSAFSEQPCEIAYVLAGVIHRHFPDALVETFAGPELWEIKDAASAADPEVVVRTRLMEKELPKFGYRYRVVLGEALGMEPLLSNARAVIKWGRRARPDPAETEALRQAFVGDSFRRWGEVLSGTFGPDGRAGVCRLLLTGVLRMDIRQRLTPETLIFAAQGR
jgi:hypothetical protein